VKYKTTAGATTDGRTDGVREEMDTKTKIEAGPLDADTLLKYSFSVVLAALSGTLSVSLWKDHSPYFNDGNDVVYLLVAGVVSAVSGLLSFRLLSVVAGPASSTGSPAKGTRQFPKLTILYGTQTGNSMRLAKHLKATWNRMARKNLAKHFDLETFEPETLVEDVVNEEHAVVVVMSTNVGGTPPKKAKVFMDWLKDYSLDFRRDRNILKRLAGAAVYGLGSTEYSPETFCKPALECARLLQRLGAKPLFGAGGDIDVACGDDANGDFEGDFVEWTNALISEFESPVGGKLAAPKATKGKRAKGKKKRSGLVAQRTKKVPVAKEEDIEETEEDKINDIFVEQSGLLDMEDIGGVMMEQKKSAKKAKAAKGPAEMVTPRQRASLTKEGYKIIGTHSAVKLCRWTKNQLRGRGGCYKHTCYGITSYQCMEATPSLACANKCTFCWRHHKNPVGTSWRWKEDDPAMIVERALALHDQMVKQMKGVPGVKPDRLAEARTVQHCALSLVGEPIMYPRINELVGELHERKISTFLVTNAQFPECIDRLDPVTQLYVSIDASTKESLEAVDRPLFKDFWERFQASLRSLRQKKQRTVYRLTLVKEHNMDEVREYSNLVALGQPDFIEVKSVTFCGKSDASDLTFGNVPFHEEVVAFSTDLVNYINEDARRRRETAIKMGGVDTEDGFCEYAIASEHQHSNLVLISKKNYQVEDKNTGEKKWHTWIDYPKYHACWRKWKDSNGAYTFTTYDYMAETPSWAVYGCAERGMDPLENRWYHNRTVRRAQAGELTEVQLKQYPSNPADQGVLDNNVDNTAYLVELKKAQKNKSK
jgi:tRNA wybutosine-synthesizing protein 1